MTNKLRSPDVISTARIYSLDDLGVMGRALLGHLYFRDELREASRSFFTEDNPGMTDQEALDVDFEREAFLIAKRGVLISKELEVAPEEVIGAGSPLNDRAIGYIDAATMAIESLAKNKAEVTAIAGV